MGASLIPLQVQTPQPQGPLQTIGQLASVRDAISQIGLRNAQTQAAQQQAQDIAAQAQQRNRDLADQNTIQQAMQDPAANARIHTGDYSDVAGKIQPKTLFGLQQQQQAFIGTKLAQTKEQNAIQSEALGEVFNTLTGLKSLTKPDGTVDLDKVNASLPDAVNHLRAIGALNNAGITAQVPTSISDPKQIDQFIASIGGGKAATDYALEQQGKQAATEKTKAEAQKLGTENTILQGQQQLYQTLRSNPQTLAAHVAASIDPQKYPAEFQRAVNEASLQPDLKGINDAIAKHSALVGEQEKSIATETDPNVIRTREAIAQSQASYQNALQQGDTARAKYYESLSDMQQSLATSRTIQKVLDLSKSVVTPSPERSSKRWYRNSPTPCKTSNAWPHRKRQRLGEHGGPSFERSREPARRQASFGFRASGDRAVYPNHRLRRGKSAQRNVSHTNAYLDSHFRMSIQAPQFLPRRSPNRATPCSSGQADKVSPSITGKLTLEPP